MLDAAATLATVSQSRLHTEGNSMSKQTIETFFAGKNLVISYYQRDYALNQRNSDDLFSDIE